MLVTVLKFLMSLFSKSTKQHIEIIEDSPFKEVRIKSDLWLLIDSARTIMTVGNTLYAHPDMWDEMIPTTYRAKAVIQIHETTHARRQFDMGIDKWVFLYLFDKKFRWEEEKLAYEAEWTYMAENGYQYADGHHRMWAEILSGKTYRNMVSFEEAYSWVSTTMKKIMEKQNV